jgi:tetratricopeptide (TPR) repeat protein
MGTGRCDGLLQGISTSSRGMWRPGVLGTRGVLVVPRHQLITNHFHYYDSSSTELYGNTQLLAVSRDQETKGISPEEDLWCGCIEDYDARTMIHWAKECAANGRYEQGIRGIEMHFDKEGYDYGKDDVDKLMLTLADMCFKSGQSKKGSKWLEKLSVIAPKDPTVWQVWGVHEWKQGRYKSAKDKFDKGMAVTELPHSPLLVAYAKMEAQRRNRTKARALLRDAVKSGQKNPHAWVTWAQLEGRNGKYRKAIRLCREGLRQHVDNVHLLCTMGQIYESFGDSEMAKRSWERALEVFPSSNFAIHELGKLAWKNGEVDKAKEYFIKGVESHDSRGAFLCGESLANVYIFQGDDDKVRSLFESIDARFTIKSSRFLRAWASFEKKSGNLAKASDVYARAAHIHPRDERTWLQWAQLEKRRHNMEKALVCVKAGVQVSPVNPFLWQLYGSLAWDSESAESGRQVFSKAMQSCPNNQQILMEWAIKEISSSNPEKGLEVLRRADTLESKHIPLLQLWSATAKSLGYEEESQRIAALIH